MDQFSSDGQAGRGLSARIVVWLIISWLWVGVPLVWGVSQTVLNTLPLFQSAPPDAGK